GSTVFTDEQRTGAYRLLGDQRVPLGSVWLAKMITRAAPLALLPVIMLVFALAMAWVSLASSHAHRYRPPFEQLLSTTGFFNLWVFLAFWPVYGFTVGQLCSLLCRRTLTALVMAVAGGLLLCAVWLPSLLGGGLHLWQTLGPPIVFLLTSYGLV